MYSESISIRTAREGDTTTIKRMIRAARLDPTSLNWPHFLIAEHEGSIVGIGQVKPYRGGRELGSLVVLPRYRKRGVGSAIVRALIKREQGELFLLCAERLESYYTQFGFVRAGLSDVSGTIWWKYALGQWIVRLFFRTRIIVMRRVA